MLKNHANRVMLLAACLGVLGFAAGAWSQDVSDAVDLRPKWTDGQTARYEVRTTRLNTMEIRGVPGAPPPRSNGLDVTTEITWQVVKADPDGGGQCRITVNKANLEVTAPDGRKLTTSDRGGDSELEPVRKLIKAMVTHPFTVTIDANGRVTKVTGQDKVKRDAGEAGEQLTDSDFHEMAHELALVAGGVAQAKAGRTWREKFNWDHEAGDVKLDSGYRFAGVELIESVPVAMINVDSKVDFEFDKSRLPQGAPVKVNLREAQHSAQIMFDLSRAEVVGRNIDRTLDFEITASLGGRSLVQRITEKTNTQVVRIQEGK